MASQSEPKNEESPEIAKSQGSKEPEKQEDGESSEEEEEIRRVMFATDNWS